jgi:4-hydroxy-3-methylbut-2-enyl diphosphate reductase
MALRQITEKVDLILVVGDPKSSNSNRLREVAERRGVGAYLINGENEIKPEWVENIATIGMTAGASTPESIVQNCIEKLKSFGLKTVEEITYIEEDVFFQLPRAVGPFAARPLSRL